MNLRKHLALVRSMQQYSFSLGMEGNPLKVATPTWGELSPEVAHVLKEIWQYNAFDAASISSFFDRIHALLFVPQNSKFDVRVLKYCLHKLIIVDRVLQFEALQEAPRSDEEDVDFNEVGRQFPVDSGSVDDDDVFFTRSRPDSASETEAEETLMCVDGLEEEEEEEDEDGFGSVSDEEDTDFNTGSEPSIRLISWICKLLGVDEKVMDQRIARSIDLCEMVEDLIAERGGAVSPSVMVWVEFFESHMTQAVRVKCDRDPSDLECERVVSLLGVTCGIGELLPPAVQLKGTAFGDVLVQPLFDEESVDPTQIREVFAQDRVDIPSFQMLSLVMLYLGMHDGQAKNFFLVDPFEDDVVRVGMTDRKSCVLDRSAIHSVLQIGDKAHVHLPISYEFLAWEKGSSAPISEDTCELFVQGIRAFISLFKSIDSEAAAKLETVFFEMLDSISVISEDSPTLTSVTHAMYPIMFMSKAMHLFVKGSSNQDTSVRILEEYFERMQLTLKDIVFHVLERIPKTSLEPLFESPQLKVLGVATASQLAAYCLLTAIGRPYSNTSKVALGLEKLFQKYNNPPEGLSKKGLPDYKTQVTASLNKLVGYLLTKVPEERYVSLSISDRRSL